MTATEVLHHPKPHEQWTTVLLPEIAWDWYDRWPDYLSVAHEAHGEWRVYVPEATLGAGMCHNKGYVYCSERYFVCSSCGCEFDYSNFACEFAEHRSLGSPHYCPNCGRKVVEE